jgi:IS605 OrfB family transposase
MRRSSLHILKYSTDHKVDYLFRLREDYMYELQRHVYMLWCDVLPLNKNLSSKDLEGERFNHSQWMQVVYKTASEIVRSQLMNSEKQNYYPIIKQFSVTLDSRLWDIQFDKTKHFNAFIRIKLPYFQQDKHKAQTINVPIKFHRQSNKFLENKDFKMNNSIQLVFKDNNFYIKFIYESHLEKREIGNDLGLDQGINKLISDSNGNHYGKNLTHIYKKLSNKIRGSKKYKKLLITKNNLINKTVKEIPLKGIKNIFIEDLSPSVKQGYGTKYRNKNQYWTYSRVINKLTLLCEENGIHLIKVDPSYTSQRCSTCRTINKENRTGEKYNCSTCGTKIDADTNGAKNIISKGLNLWSGAYSPTHKKKR